jgi:RNA polymerase sigma-70 factor (ECF subfamily)
VIKSEFTSIHPHVGDAFDPISNPISTGVTAPSLRASSPSFESPSSERLHREIRENYEFLWRSLRRLGVASSSVEDAAQQVLVVFARRIDDVHEGAERAFLFATATRVASDHRRKQARGREDADTEALDRHASSLPSVEQLIDQGRARELLDWVLAELPIDLRTVFILFEIEDINMANIAEMLDLAPGTVASRLRRARMMFESTAARLQRIKRSR